jgi:hypothetical protein
MSRLYLTPLFLVLLAFTFVSCEDSGVVNCPKKWFLSNNQSLSVSFDNNGHLFMGSNSLSQAFPPTSLQYLDTISGDFEIVVDYEGLFFNSPGLGFQITLTANAVNEGNNYMSAMVGTTLVPGLPTGVLHIGAAIDSLGNAPSFSNGSYLQAAATSGQFRLRRAGANVEVISSTGTSGNIVTYSKTFFSSSMAFRITYGSNYPQTPQYTSSIRFTNLRYYQGSTLVDSDGFDCNSVQ